MKYFSIDCIKDSYGKISKTTKEKFWGILGILYSVSEAVKPSVNYSIDTGKLSSFLEDLFRLNNKKKYDSNNPYSVVFSNDWPIKTSEYYLVGKPNILPVIVWAYRKHAFSDQVTTFDLFEMFLNDFHISKELIELMFQVNLDDTQINYSDSLYDDISLLKQLGGSVPTDMSTIKMNQSFVVANAGDLSRGPFFQPLYASLSTLECLIIFPFDASEYYHVFSSIESNESLIGNKKVENLQVIYYGAPGTGKSHIINEQTCHEEVIRTTFHPDSDYSTFVGAYKPTTKEVPMRDVTGKVIRENGIDITEDRIVYEFVEQAFLQAYVAAWKFYAAADGEETPQQQYLVIEEINRGNCAQIFGDLFQLLDRNGEGFSDYPIVADNDMRKQLARVFKNLIIAKKDCINACYKCRDMVSQVLEGKILLLPNNLHIWATMNTSDQSLFPIDSAFKRRWDWQYMPISKGRDYKGDDMAWHINADMNAYDWWSFLTKINTLIGSITNSEDKKLGYFFCKADSGSISAETFVSKVIFYLWNDVFKDYGFEVEVFKDTDNTELSFNKFYCVDGNGDTFVCKDKVELFLANLGVSIIGSIEDEEDESIIGNEQNKNYDRYSINDEGNWPKKQLATKLIEKYVELNPQVTADDVIRDWMSLGIKVSHFVEGQEQYNRRTDKPRVNQVSWGDNQAVWVTSNGWTPDTASALIEAVNNKDWGLRIENLV